MLSKKNINEDLTPEQKERIQKLKVIIDKFENIALNYGPTSADELKNRINKVVRSFDNEFKLILEKKFDLFWNSKKRGEKKSENDFSGMDVPKFLRNYKK